MKCPERTPQVQNDNTYVRFFYVEYIQIHLKFNDVYFYGFRLHMAHAATVLFTVVLDLKKYGANDISPGRWVWQIS